MPLFLWYKNYSVNNDELDGHHKGLFDLLNRLYDNCLVKNTANCVEPIIEELVSYSKYHFAAEEQHMRSMGYKDLEKHAAEHVVFAHKALQLRQVINKNDYEVMKELIAFLGNWLLHHVLEEDKKYSM